MTKRVIVMCLFTMLVLSLFAQQGQYERKSITSVESVWLSGTARQAGDFNYSFFDMMVDQYIKVPRFDYNILPDGSIRDFRASANALSTINPTTLAEVMKNTIGKDIARLLSDPDIQLARAADLEDESARIQLARIKGREYGLTEDMIIQLMNSAYIYLPYISSISKTYENSEYSYIITGGILWYRVHIDSDGKATLVLRQSSTTLGMGSADASKPKNYEKFRFGSRVFQTTPQEYAQFDAIQAWVKNLGVKMKDMPEFALSAQIVERLPGNRFSSELGLREGIHLDDGFHVVEMQENRDGNLSTKKIGYARIISNADNRKEENRNVRSIAKTYYGSGIMEGALLMENPRLGIDIAVGMGPRIGMNIPKSASWAPFAGYVFDEDCTSAFELDVNFAYNLAPIVGITQLFYDLEVAYGLPIVSYNSEVESSTAYTISAYTGLTKKLWFGRHAIAVMGKIGYDRFVTTTVFNSNDISIAANALGAKLGADYIYMLSPNWQVYGGLDLKFGTAPFSSSLIVNDNDYDFGTANYHDDINLGGTQIQVGISHALGQLPFNLFGFLDPYKKY